LRGSVASVDLIRRALEEKKIRFISEELAVGIKSIESTAASASFGMTIDVTSRRTVVVLKIDSLKVVGALVSNTSTLIAAGSSVETLFVTTLEGFITSEGLKSSITFRGHTGVARLNAEVLVKLLEEALSLLIQVTVIIPSPGTIRNKASTEVKTLVTTRSSEDVAVFTSSPEGNRVSSILSVHRHEVSVVTRVSSTSRNLKIAHPRTVEVVGIAPDLLGPSGLKWATVVANSDQNTFTLGHDDSPSHGLRLSRDGIVEVVVPVIVLKATSVMVIGLKKNVVTSLLNLKGIADMVVTEGLESRFHSDVEVSPDEVARRNPDGKRLVLRVDIKVVVHSTTEISTTSAALLEARLTVVHQLTEVPWVTTRLHAVFGIERTFIVIAIVVKRLLSETIDLTVGVSTQRSGKVTAHNANGKETTLDVVDLNNSMRDLFIITFTFLKRMNLVVVSPRSVISFNSVQNVIVNTISDRDIRGDLNRVDLQINKVREQAEGNMSAVGFRRTFMRSSTDKNAILTGVQVTMINDHKVVTRFVGTEVSESTLLGASVVSIFIRVSGVTVAADPSIDVTVLGIGNFNNQTIISLEPVVANIQSVHLIHSRFEFIPEDLTKSQLLGIITHISVDVVRSFRDDGNKVSTILEIAEVVDVHRGSTSDLRIIFTISRVGTTSPSEIILVDIHLSGELGVNQHAEESTIMVSVGVGSLEAIEVMFMRASIIIIIISVIHGIIEQILNTNRNLVDSHTVVDGRIITIGVSSIHGHVQIIISADVVGYQFTSEIIRVTNERTITREGGSKEVVVHRKNHSLVNIQVFNTNAKNRLLRSLDGSRSKTMEVVFALLDSVADGFVDGEIGDEPVGLNSKSILNGVKFALLLLSENSDPECGRKISQLTIGSSNKSIISHLNVAFRISSGTVSVQVDRVFTRSLTHVRSHSRVNGEGHRSLGDVEETNLGVELLVEVGINVEVRININTVDLVVRSERQIKVNISGTVDGAMVNNIRVDDGYSRIVAFNHNLSTTRSIGPEVVATTAVRSKLAIRNNERARSAGSTRKLLVVISEGRASIRETNGLVGLSDQTSTGSRGHGISGETHRETKHGTNIERLNINGILLRRIAHRSVVLNSVDARSSNLSNVHIGLERTNVVSGRQIQMFVSGREHGVDTTDTNVVVTGLELASIKEECAAVVLRFERGIIIDRSSSTAVINRTLANGRVGCSGTSGRIRTNVGLHITTDGANLNSKGSTFTETITSVDILLIFVREHNFSQSFSVLQSLNGGLVSPEVDGELNRRGILSTNEVSSSLGSTRTKSESINGAPGRRTGQRALITEAIVTEHFEINSLTSTSRSRSSEVEHEVLVIGKIVIISRNVDDIAIVVFTITTSVQLSLSSGVAVEVVNNAFTLSSALDNFSERDLSVVITQDAGRNAVRHTSRFFNSNIIDTGRQAEEINGVITRRHIEIARTDAVAVEDSNASKTVASRGRSSTITVVDVHGSRTGQTINLNTEVTSLVTSVGLAVVQFQIVSSDVELVMLDESRIDVSGHILLVHTDVDGGLGDVGGQGVVREIRGSTSKIDIGVTDGNVPVAFNNITRRNLPQTTVVGVSQFTMILPAEAAFVEATRKSLESNVDIQGTSVRSRASDIYNPRLFTIKIVIINGENIVVVVLLFDTTNSVDRDTRGSSERSSSRGMVINLDGLREIGLYNSEANGSGTTNTTGVANGNIVALELISTARRHNESVRSITVLSAAAHVHVAGISRSSEFFSFDVHDASTRSELGLDSQTTVVVNGNKVDIEAHETIILGIGTIINGVSGRVLVSVHNRVELNRTNVVGIGTANVSHLPLDGILKTSTIALRSSVTGRNNTEIPISSIIGAVLVELARPDTNGTTFTVKRITIAIRSNTSTKFAEMREDVIAVVGRGGGISTEGARSSLARSQGSRISVTALMSASRLIGVEVNVERQRLTRIVGDAVEEHFQHLTTTFIHASRDIFKADELSPSIRFVNLVVKNIQLSASGSISNTIIEGEVSSGLDERRNTLLVDEDVVRGLNAITDTLNSNVVLVTSSQRLNEAVRELPVALASSHKTVVAAKLSNVAVRFLSTRNQLVVVYEQSTITNRGDLNNDVMTVSEIIIINGEFVVVVTLITNKLEGLSVGNVATKGDERIDDHGGNQVDFKSVTNRSVEHRSGRGLHINSPDAEEVRTRLQLTRRNLDLAPLSLSVTEGFHRGGTGVLPDEARATTSKITLLSIYGHSTVLNVVNFEDDVRSITNALRHSEAVMLNITQLKEMASVRITIEQVDSNGLHSSSESVLDGSVVELTRVTIDGDVVSSRFEVTGMQLPRAARLGFAHVHVVEARSIPSTMTSLKISSDHILILVGVQVNSEILIFLSGGINEVVVVATFAHTIVMGNTTSETVITDGIDRSTEGESSDEVSFILALDSNKPVITRPFAVRNHDGAVGLSGSVNLALVLVTTQIMSGRSTLVDVHPKRIPSIVSLAHEVTVLDEGSLENKIVQRQCLGTNTEVRVLKSLVPLGNFALVDLSQKKRSELRSIMDGGSQGVTNRSGVGEVVLVHSENGNVPNTRTEVRSRNDHGAAIQDRVHIRDSLNIASSTRNGTGAVVQVIVARAVSSQVVVVDESLNGLGNTMLNVGDLHTKRGSLLNLISADVVVLVLTLEDSLGVTHTTLDGESNIKVSPQSVLNRHLVEGVISVSRITSMVTIHRDEQGTRSQFTGLDHESTGFTLNRFVIKERRSSGTDTKTTRIAGNTVEIGTMVALSTRKITMKYRHNNLGIASSGVQFNEQPSINSRGHINNVEVIQSLSNVLGNRNTSNETLRSSILHPVGSHGESDGKTRNVVNKRSIVILAGNGYGNVPGSRSKVTFLNDKVASITSATSSIGRDTGLNTTSKVATNTKTLVNKEIDNTTTDVAQVNHHVGLTRNNGVSGNIDTEVSISFRLNKSLESHIADKLSDGGRNGGGNNSVVGFTRSVKGIVRVIALRKFDSHVPATIFEVARINNQLACKLEGRTSAELLSFGEALTRDTRVRADRTIEGRTTNGGEVDTVFENEIVHTETFRVEVFLTNNSSINGINGQVLVHQLKTHTREGLSTRDVYNKVGTLRERLLRDINSIEAIVQDVIIRRVGGSLIQEHSLGNAVGQTINWNGSVSKTNTVRQFTITMTGDGQVIGGILELRPHDFNIAVLVASVVVVVRTGKFTKSRTNDVVAGQFVLKILIRRSDNVEVSGSKDVVIIVRLLESDGNIITGLNVGEFLQSVVVGFTRKNDSLKTILRGNDVSIGDECLNNGVHVVEGFNSDFNSVDRSKVHGGFERRERNEIRLSDISSRNSGNGVANVSIGIGNSDLKLSFDISTSLNTETNSTSLSKISSAQTKVAVKIGTAILSVVLNDNGTSGVRSGGNIETARTSSCTEN